MIVTHTQFIFLLDSNGQKKNLKKYLKSRYKYFLYVLIIPYYKLMIVYSCETCQSDIAKSYLLIPFQPCFAFIL